MLGRADCKAMRKFDAAEAAYAYFYHWHGGQYSESYRKLCVLAKVFKPGPMWKGVESLSDEGREIYEDMKRRKVHMK